MRPVPQSSLVLSLALFGAACSDDKHTANHTEALDAGTPDAETKQAEDASDAREQGMTAAAATKQKPMFKTKPIKDTSGGAIKESCRGFDFNKLVYSPGCEVLPNKCEPYHATTNNPYAVRCIDAWPWYKTQYPGDECCILPPPPDKGIQYGVHPQRTAYFEKVSTGDISGYDDLDTEWTMASGEEEETNYQTGATNAADAKFYRNYARMRPGSHHMIVSTASPSIAKEVWSGGSPAGLLGGTNLPGAQRPDENGPKSLAKPEEDSGLYSTLPAMIVITFNMHHFNAADATILFGSTAAVQMATPNVDNSKLPDFAVAH